MGLLSYHMWWHSAPQQQPGEQLLLLHHPLYHLAPKGLNETITQHHEGKFPHKPAVIGQGWKLTLDKFRLKIRCMLSRQVTPSIAVRGSSPRSVLKSVRCLFEIYVRTKTWDNSKWSCSPSQTKDQMLSQLLQSLISEAWQLSALVWSPSTHHPGSRATGAPDSGGFILPQLTKPSGSSKHRGNFLFITLKPCLTFAFAVNPDQIADTKQEQHKTQLSFYRFWKNLPGLVWCSAF